MSKKQRVKEEIIDAGLDEFSEYGEDATMRHIAKRSGFSVVTIYNNFENKLKLRFEIGDKVGNELVNGIMEQIGGLNDAESKIRKLTWYYLNYFEKHEKEARFNYIAIRPEIYYEYPFGFPSPVRVQADLLEQILVEGQRTGELRKEMDTRIARVMYFAVLREITIRWLSRKTRGRDEKLTELIEPITDLFLSAYLAKGKPTKPASFSKRTVNQGQRGSRVRKPKD